MKAIDSQVLSEEIPSSTTVIAHDDVIESISSKIPDLKKNDHSPAPPADSLPLSPKHLNSLNKSIKTAPLVESVPKTNGINGHHESLSLTNGHASPTISPRHVNGVNGENLSSKESPLSPSVKLNGHHHSSPSNGLKLTNGISNGVNGQASPTVVPHYGINGQASPKVVPHNGMNSHLAVENGSATKSNNSSNGHHAASVSTNGCVEDWDRALCEVKDKAIARLQEQLQHANHELRLRDEEVSRLSKIRNEVEAELEDLTASLFQEAHNMVRHANVQQAQAERSLAESQMKVEVLQAEVAALKTLVLTSTPSRPNPHLHPQLQADPSAAGQATSGMNLFNRKHRRSPSHFNLKYGRENSPPDSPVKEPRGSPAPHEPLGDLSTKDDLEVDPVVHKEFLAWKQAPRLDQSDPFVSRVYKEDIELCLDFCNAELGLRVREAVEAGAVFIEAVTEKSRTVFPKKCALMEVPRLCHYRLKLGDEEQWFYISQICRNRIIAVCDFLNYLRYIERGLVKSSVLDVFWEITRLRKEMVLARLGLPLS